MCAFFFFFFVGRILSLSLSLSNDVYNRNTADPLCFISNDVNSFMENINRNMNGQCESHLRIFFANKMSCCLARLFKVCVAFYHTKFKQITSNMIEQAMCVPTFRLHFVSSIQRLNQTIRMLEYVTVSLCLAHFDNENPF